MGIPGVEQRREEGGGDLAAVALGRHPGRPPQRQQHQRRTGLPGRAPAAAQSPLPPEAGPRRRPPRAARGRWWPRRRSPPPDRPHPCAPPHPPPPRLHPRPSRAVRACLPFQALHLICPGVAPWGCGRATAGTAGAVNRAAPGWRGEGLPGSSGLRGERGGRAPQQRLQPLRVQAPAVCQLQHVRRLHRAAPARPGQLQQLLEECCAPGTGRLVTSARRIYDRRTAPQRSRAGPGCTAKRGQRTG